MNQNLLLDMLGVLIGFSGIMLILSLLATALTQAIVHMLSLRAKNLQVGLAELLDSVQTAKSGEELARDVLNSNSLIKGSRIGKTSWILKEEFKMLLKDHGAFSEDSIKKAMGWFSRMERGLSQRFRGRVRRITLVCALIIAAVFQVSTPDLLKRLSTDKEYRVRAAMIAEEIGGYETGYPETIKYEDVSWLALEELQRNHPDLRETLEEVSGIGSTMDDILDEFLLVLEDHPQREAMTYEYRSTLERLHQKKYEEAIGRATEYMGKLALLDITPLSRGVGYYRDVSNVLGILATAVFVGLGAPFWFNTLRNLMSLRDSLAPDKAEDKTKKRRQNT
jgi:hypothetical protein